VNDGEIAIDVDVCPTCGALVGDSELHDRWHDERDLRAQLWQSLIHEHVLDRAEHATA
jgi:hypothetical protein